MDAFDADVLIFAASATHPLGAPVRALFEADAPGIGSVLLVPEVLTKPLRDEGAAVADGEAAVLATFLGRLDLVPVDAAIANLATVLGARYALRAADAVHLATAVSLGADRFLTNNRTGFPRSIAEVDVTYPSDLAP